MKRQFNSKVVFAIIISILSVYLFGCSVPAPDKIVKTFFDELQKSDINTASTYLSKDAANSNTLGFDGPLQEKMAKQILGKLKCEIISTSVNGDTAVVKSKITAPDLANITAKMLSELLPSIFAKDLGSDGSDEDKTNKIIEDYFSKSISDPNVALVTTEIDIKLIKDKIKKTWLIQPDDTLSNAITGNALKAFEALKLSNPISKKNGNTKSDSTTGQKIYYIGEEAKIARTSITILNITKSSGEGFTKPKQGNEFIILTVRKRNISDSGPITYDPSEYKIQNPMGQRTSSIDFNVKKKFGSGKLSPGEEVEGDIVFEVPKDTQGLMLICPSDGEPLLKFKIS